MSLLTLRALTELKTAGNFGILTFVGYSGAGYEDLDALHAQIKTVLSFYDPKRYLVNCGATEEGIGAVYALAKAEGFETIGIVSSQAAVQECKVSRYVDTVFFVPDETWGGYLPNGELSPTSAAIVDVSDVIVGIGGGEVARDELLAAKSDGRCIIYIPADLNHLTAIKKAVSKGQPTPTDFSGAANVITCKTSNRKLQTLNLNQ
jgi:hypothetical protein